MMDLHLRRATSADLPAILALFAGGNLDGASATVTEGHRAAFARIAEDPAHALYVVEEAGAVVGTMHAVWITFLAGAGRPDLQLESVHVAAAQRGRGIGAWMMRWAIAEARSRNARRIQLTTDARRTDAHRFYQRLGFAPSHVGMKLVL